LPVWGEVANCFGSDARAKDNLIKEWSQIVRRDRNHPSIVAWVPINESWGTGDMSKVDNQHWLRSLYYWTKTMDPGRPVIDNDGWEHVYCDIMAHHDYSKAEEYAERYPEKTPIDIVKFWTELDKHRPTYAPGCVHRDVPVIITEWGGWGLYVDNPGQEPDHHKAWGYQGILYKNFDEILDMYEAVIRELAKRKDYIWGHCYTEFCDYYQEVNGMLTFDRKP
ncbi:MAG: glycoside hydrolase family 2 TIM barrel-domain containing protein, partial [Candidatus Hodarchaeota archaeon]